MRNLNLQYIAENNFFVNLVQYTVRLLLTFYLKHIHNSLSIGCANLRLLDT
jgi:hypothetical protein